MLFLLIFHSLSNKCKYSITVEDTLPKTYTFEVDEGEHICVNSTAPFLTAAFHNSLLKIRYFQVSSHGELLESNHFLYPAEKAGLGYGATKGSIDIMALIPDKISFSLFAYPPSCGPYRYITTRSDIDINIQQTFGTFTNNMRCIWYSHQNFRAKISAIPEFPSSISVCSNKTKCNEPFTQASKPVTFSSTSSILISAKSKSYYDELQLTLESIQKKETVSAPFEIDTKLDLTQITLFEISDSDQRLNNDEIENRVENDDDDENPVQKVDNDEIRAPLILPQKHGKKESTRRIVSTGEKLAFLSVVIAIFIIIIQCFVCDKNSIRSKFRNTNNRESELRLLSNQKGLEYNRPSAFSMSNQMPITGVYFPPTTTTINDDVHHQSQQPQPLLLIPTTIGTATTNNGQQQPLFYPQMIPAAGQQNYYPQYGFVSAPVQLSTYQVPQNQPQ